MSISNICMRLAEIQAALNVPKTRLNKYAQNPFYYRNAEDILNAAKPLCLKQGLLLYCFDRPISIDGWHYIEAHAVLTDGTERIEVTASARESESRKGFDCSQLSGSASSYARKYALNGLFDLDDNQDPDSMNNSSQNIVCPRCGKPVKDVVGKNGKTISAAELMNQYGMCADCVKDAKHKV